MIQLSNIGGEVNNIFLGFETHPNIKLKLYEPVNPLLPLAWNNRLHDKIILVDNKFGLTGGRNIEDRFYLMDDYKDSFVKDRDVLLYHDETEKRNLNSNRSENNISNSVIDDMQVYYNKLWNHKYSKPKYRYMTNRRVDKGELFVNKLRLEHKNSKEEFIKKHFKNMKTIDWTKKTIAANNIRFISNPIVRYDKDPRCLKTTLQLSSESKNSIFIQSPYVIPSKSIKTTFKQYNIDLDKIHLLTNSSASSPNLIAFSGYNNHKKNMIDNGLTIYEYQGPGSIHAKTAIFDQQVSIIGTFNVDSRSSYLSTESMVIIDSKEISNTLKKEMQKNLFHSLEVNDNYKY